MRLKAFFLVCIYVIFCLISTNISAQQKAKAGDRKSAENYLSQGKNIAEKDRRAAMNFMEKAIAADSTFAEAHAEKGKLLLAENQFDEAVKALQKAVSQNYTNEQVYSNLGFAYARVNKNAEAVNYLSKAISLDPTNLENYAHRAYAYINLEQYERAEQDYKLFLMKNPDDAIGWYNLSRAQYSQKKFDDCIGTLNKVNALQPGYLDTYFWLGLSYAGKLDFANALNWFDKAIAQKPDAGYLYFNRGIAKGRLNRNDFCADFKKAVELGYTDAEKMVANYCK